MLIMNLNQIKNNPYPLPFVRIENKPAINQTQVLGKYKNNLELIE